MGPWMQSPWFWWGVALALFAAEALLPGTFLLWLGFAALTMNWLRIRMRWWEFGLLALAVVMLFRPGFFMDRLAPEYARAPAAHRSRPS